MQPKLSRWGHARAAGRRRRSLRAAMVVVVVVVVVPIVATAGAATAALSGAAAAATTGEATGGGPVPSHPSYTFRTLGSSQDPAFDQLLGINSYGTIVGYDGSGAAGRPSKGFTLGMPYTTSSYATTSYPGSTQTQVRGLNDRGVTVGVWSTANDATHALDPSSGFVDASGVFTDVKDPTTTSTPPVDQLLGVNDAGVAVGFYDDSAGHSHGFTYNLAAGQFTPVVVTGAVVSSANAINNLGGIAGSATLTDGTTVAYYLTPTGTLTEADFPGSTDTVALGINDFGEVVGSYVDAAGHTHGFTWRPATHVFVAVDDPTGGGAAGTAVNGVNNAGDLVGSYQTPTGTTHGLLATPQAPGYYTAAADGGIFAYDAVFHGSMGGQPLNAPIVGLATTPDGRGYWLAAADGGVFAFGDAGFYGSMGGKRMNAPIVGIAAAPTGHGYWEVASDGGIFAFGSAGFHGSLGGQHLVAPVVGIAADPSTGGYWMVAADGGVFAFTAPSFGSMGGHPLDEPVVAMAPTPDGRGYWLTAADGGIFSFGDATFFGSMGGMPLNEPVVGMAGTTGSGYWFVAADGGIFSYGDAGFHGSMGGRPLDAPMIGMAPDALG